MGGGIFSFIQQTQEFADVPELVPQSICQPNVSADQGSRVIQTRLSPEMKTRLKALAKDADTPDTARRALHDISADK